MVADRIPVERWYALYTKSRNEKKVKQALDEKGFRNYLPLEKRLKQWSDRKKWVEEPLIRSYIFVHCTEGNLQSALNTPGVVTVVRFEGKPAPVQEEQIHALQQILEADADYEISAESFAKGEKVEIIAGRLKGLKGELQEHLNKYKVLIRLDVIQQNILVKINPARLHRITENFV